MNITFTKELSNKAAADKEASILIRMTQNRKLKRMATGIKVLPELWDPVKKKVKKKHPLSEQYNKLLEVKLAEVIKSYSKLLEIQGQVTPDDIYRELNKDKNTNFFDFAYSTKMAEIKSSKKLGTYRRYEAVLSKLQNYAGKHLSINRVNYAFIKEYGLYLKNTLQNTTDTASSNFSVIRTILNEAIRHGIYKGNNPFDQVKLKYTDNTKEKLTAEEMKKIFTTPLPQIPTLLLSRDFFLACFLAEGTRAGDMMLMKHDHIINNCLVFQQQKTGAQMVIPIVDELQTIIDRNSTGECYIFPFLKDVATVDEVSINSRITLVNKYLKELAKYCGIFKNLSTHVSRHTYTDLALLATNENIYKVQRSLGHSSVKTTEIYSRRRLSFERVSPVARIINLINGK
ncbi:MAG: site-specific integrase [Bacteroidetes bacterium]|nr:site-specific integrase [Bacteroidota bacterium]